MNFKKELLRSRWVGFREIRVRGFAGFRVSGLGSGFGLRFKGVSLYRVSRIYGSLCL